MNREEECEGVPIEEEPRPPPPDPRLMCSGSAGLLSKVSNLFIRQSIIHPTNLLFFSIYIGRYGTYLLAQDFFYFSFLF